jgi:hypothetical protein
MPRVAFPLRLKKDAGPAYDESHKAVAGDAGFAEDRGHLGLRI